MDPVGKIDIENWMETEPVRVLFDALEAGGGTARFVGGCVRDSVMGRGVSDIDIATDLTPQRVMECVQACDLTAIPTGIEHGTVTVVIDRQGTVVARHAGVLDEATATALIEELI